MQCLLCKDAAARVQDLEESLHQSQTRAINAIRQAAKWKVELESRGKVEKNLLSRATHSEERERELESSVSRYKQQVHELAYKNKRLTKDVSDLKERLSQAKTATNARLARLAKTIQSTEDEAIERAQRVKVAAKSMQGSVLDLQRHLGSQGFHAVNSFTAKRLLEKLWDSSTKLVRACDTVSTKNTPAGNTSRRKRSLLRSMHHELDIEEEGVDSIILSERGSEGSDEESLSSEDDDLERVRRLLHSKTKRENKHARDSKDFALMAKGGRIRFSGGENALRELSDLCVALEKENKRLRAKVESPGSRKGKSSGDLVPKYRTEIVKARATIRQLEDRIEELQLETERLEKKRKKAETKADTQQDLVYRLERENKDLTSKLQQLEENESRRRKMLSTLKRDRPKFDIQESIGDLTINNDLDASFLVEGKEETQEDNIPFSDNLYDQVATGLLNSSSIQPSSSAPPYEVFDAVDTPSEWEAREYIGYSETVPLRSPALESGALESSAFVEGFAGDDVTRGLKDDLHALNAEIAALQRSLETAEKLTTPRSIATTPRSSVPTPRSIR